MKERLERLKLVEKPVEKLVELGEWLESRAVLSERERQFKDAAQYWAQLLQHLMASRRQNDVDVSRLAAIHYRLGLAHRALNDNIKSLYHLKYSVRLNASEPRYFEAFGKAFLTGGHWKVARAQFAKALSLDPTNVTYLRQYAWVLLIMGRKRDALRYAKTALRLKPTNKECQLSVIRVFMEMGLYLHAHDILRDMRPSPRIVQLKKECTDKLETTIEGEVLRLLRKGLLAELNGPFNLMDLRLAEQTWKKFCLAGVSRMRFGSWLPNVWAAAVAYLIRTLKRKEDSLSDLDEIVVRFGTTTLEVWPCIKKLQEWVPVEFRDTLRMRAAG